MAAVTFPLLHLLPAGSHVVITDDSYRRTRQFCEEHLRRFNVSCTVVPLGDYAVLEDAIRPETRVLFSETPSNPYLRILDLERFAEIGRRRGVITLVDSTLATPINTRPLDYGVDLVAHSATKYLGGHNDLLAGFIAGRKELLDPLRESIGILGGISDPQTAFLLLRGMKTLAVRMEAHNLAVVIPDYPGHGIHTGFYHVFRVGPSRRLCACIPLLNRTVCPIVHFRAGQVKREIKSDWLPLFDEPRFLGGDLSGKIILVRPAVFGVIGPYKLPHTGKTGSALGFRYAFDHKRLFVHASHPPWSMISFMLACEPYFRSAGASA